MKTIIAGSRYITDRVYVPIAVSHSKFKITELVSGGAKGIDSSGELWAKENGIPVKKFPANWQKFGRGAGPIRNKQMAEYANALIAIWDGESKGTMNMIKQAKEKGLRVFVWNINET